MGLVGIEMGCVLPIPFFERVQVNIWLVPCGFKYIHGTTLIDPSHTLLIQELPKAILHWFENTEAIINKNKPPKESGEWSGYTHNDPTLPQPVT